METVTEPVVEATADDPTSSETTASVNDPLSAATDAASQATSQAPGEEADDAAVGSALDASDVEEPPAGEADPIEATTGSEASMDTAGSAAGATATPEMAGPGETGSIVDAPDPISDAPTPLTGPDSDTVEEAIGAIQATATDTIGAGASAESDVTDTVTTVADEDALHGTDPAIETTVNGVTETLVAVSQVVGETASADPITETDPVTDVIAAADPATDVIAAADDPLTDVIASADPVTDVIAAADDPLTDVIAAADPVTDVIAAADDPLTDVIAAADDPVSDAVGSVGDTASDATGSVESAASDTVGPVDDVVGGITAPVGPSSASSPTGDVLGETSSFLDGASSDTSTSDPDRSASTTGGSSHVAGWDSTIATRRDSRARWSGDAVELVAASESEVAGQGIHNVSDCPVGNSYLCSLTDDLFDFGSMVDTVTSIIRVLAFTGATLLPWIVTGLFLGLIGALALLVTRGRSAGGRPLLDPRPDSWAYPEVAA